MIGMSAPLLGAILAACGGANNSSSATSSRHEHGARPAAGTPKKGGTLRVATQAPSAAVNPLTVADSGGLAMLNQTGEFLDLRQQPEADARADAGAELEPEQRRLRVDVQAAPGRHLPQRPGDDGRRRGLHASSSCSDPKNASYALSAIGGRAPAERRPEGRRHDGRLPPRGSQRQLPLPRLVRQLQRDHRPQRHRLQQVAEHVRRHRRVQAQELHPERRRRVRRQPVALGRRPVPGRQPASPSTRVSRHRSSPSRAARSTSSPSSSCRGRRDCSTTPSFTIITLKSSNHRELSMRNDQAPFTDARVRQAVALSMDRPGMVAALLAGKGQLGNDSAFAPVFPSTDTIDPPAHAEHREGQAAAVCRRPPERLQHLARAPRSTRRSRSSRR